MKSIFLLLTTISFLFVGCNDNKPPGQTKQEKENEQELEKAIRDLHEGNQKRYEENGEISTNPEGIERVIDVAKKMEEGGASEQANAGRLLRIWMTMMHRDTRAVENNLHLITKGTDYGSIKSTDDIDKMSQLIKQYRVHNDKITEKVKHGWMSEFRTTATKEGAKDEDIYTFLQEIKSGFNRVQPHILAVRKSDDDMCVAVLEQHQVLKKYWGKWEWNAAEEVPDFTDDDGIDAYNAAAVKIQKSADDQAVAQKKLIQAQRGR